MEQFKGMFLLDPSITFLNFGSFGACPRPVFEAYQDIQQQLEREPVQFIVVEGMEMLRQSRKRLSEYVRCHEDDLVYVTNPSYAINTVARSLKLSPGEEVLTTDLEYGAMDYCWQYHCQKAGAKYVRSPIHLPITDKAALMEQFWKGYSTRTKAVFISHITSATGLILPVDDICREARRRGLLTIVDGAHAPAHVLLDLTALDADIYTGACHKWMMSPKGASFLYVRREHQDWIDPLLISWGYKAEFPSHSRFLDYHQTAGTRDFSAFLTVPACLDFLEKHNWPSVSGRCREMVLDNGQRFCDITGTSPLAPLTEEWYGQLFSIPVSTKDPVQLYERLFRDYRIEIPVTRQDGRYFVRYSIQAYNEPADLDRLETALREIRDNSDLLG